MITEKEYKEAKSKKTSHLEIVFWREYKEKLKEKYNNDESSHDLDENLNKIDSIINDLRGDVIIEKMRGIHPINGNRFNRN